MRQRFRTSDPVPIQRRGPPSAWSHPGPRTRVRACGAGPVQCYLNLHSTTDSSNVGAVFSAEAAVGLAAGVGNVGDSLLDYTEGDTYLTNDGGATWSLVRRGPHLHEFADWGAVIVLVNDKDPTQHVRCDPARAVSPRGLASTH